MNGWRMVRSETRRDAQILVRNPSPRLFGEKFRDSKKVKTNHEKTRLRDLSKTLPRFRDPAKIFRDPRFSRHHSPPLNENINKYSSLSKKMRDIFTPVVHTINGKTWCRARVWSIKAGKISKNRNKQTSDQEHEKNCIVPERKEIKAVCVLTPRLFSHSTLMHQSIPAAPSQPPPPGLTPGH